MLVLRMDGRRWESPFLYTRTWRHLYRECRPRQGLPLATSFKHEGMSAPAESMLRWIPAIPSLHFTERALHTQDEGP
jgi:hypothetical protein